MAWEIPTADLAVVFDFVAFLEALDFVTERAELVIGRFEVFTRSDSFAGAMPYSRFR
ncbi:hypothetical protein [Halostagnicola sp. A-GB9-2]|uniref:hypothetical protein n=1 Tax=Halostagnicola sp. A-GB9-2 TaxID=3048066 RepID=UPI0024BFAB59|nr:hypothetical protein [Halostagnicola sp. A-GB9-2]MDJ1434774.1 hypothetical protein [Halostagnicola sp. A-GB9-2]